MFTSATAPPPRPPPDPLPARHAAQQQEQQAAAQQRGEEGGGGGGAAAGQRREEGSSLGSGPALETEATSSREGEGEEDESAGSWLDVEQRIREAEHSGKIQILRCGILGFPGQGRRPGCWLARLPAASAPGASQGPHPVRRAERAPSAVVEALAGVGQAAACCCAAVLGILSPSLSLFPKACVPHPHLPLELGPSLLLKHPLGRCAPAWNAPPPRSPFPRSPFPPHALLLRSVDDDPVNQLVIQRMLTKAGFRVIKAATGDKALDLVQVGAGSPGLRACILAFSFGLQVGAGSPGRQAPALGAPALLSGAGTLSLKCAAALRLEQLAPCCLKWAGSHMREPA